MANENKKLVHSVEVEVRWGDMDAFGHVNNSVFLTYFEQARISWWQSITPPDISFTDTGPVIINAYCVFLKAITYPETVNVKLWAGPPGRSSYENFYVISSQKEDSILYAEGSTKVVWVDRKLERSIPLPDYIKNHLPEN
ncbi:MAG: Thioesterase superfamily protein [uncultured bacterium]|nr:MAG: Thioesterase superfamily protein [uncultured bacterium]